MIGSGHDGTALKPSGIQNRLATEAPVLYIETTDSTMAEARRLVETESGAESVVSGTVIAAGHQTAGRGRVSSRRWESKPGDSLLFTVIFNRDDLSRRTAGKPFTLLPLLCGLAAALTIEQLCEAAGEKAGISIKWPNDVFADEKKICGILCESSGDFIYAGIGVNLNQSSFDEGLRRPACSLKMICRQDNFVSEVLPLLLQNLDSILQSNSWQAEIENRLFKMNEEVAVLNGLAGELNRSEQNIVKGILRGIAVSGALLIETSAGVISIMNGELQV